MKKLLIVDDHPVVLEGLAHVFKSEGYEVLKAGTIDQAMTIVKSSKEIDVMVVDLTVNEDADGISFIRSLRKKGIDTPAIVYTMHEELWNIALLIEASVEGIVLKGERINELIEAVKEVENGGTYRSPVFTQRLSSLKYSSESLTPKDIEVLNLISNGVSTSDIAQKMRLSNKAIEYHRGSIIKKLDSKNMTQAIRNAVKLGIIQSLVFVSTLAVQAQDGTTLQAIDLGLSVNWADRNLDATSPLEAGGYFAFGETEEKEVYSWDTYENCDYGDMYMQHDLGDESICATKYDAAYVKTGGIWRLPTLDEMEELLENCETEFFAAEDETPAYARFSASNGGYIDIPVVGYMSNGNLIRDNKETEIFTGTFDTDEEEEDGIVYRINSAYALGLVPMQTAIVVPVSSHLGFQIRPVTDGNTSSVSAITETTKPSAIYTIDGRLVNAPLSALSSGIYIRHDGIHATKFIHRQP